MNKLNNSHKMSIIAILGIAGLVAHMLMSKTCFNDNLFENNVFSILTFVIAAAILILAAFFGFCTDNIASGAKNSKNFFLPAMLLNALALISVCEFFISDDYTTLFSNGITDYVMLAVFAISQVLATIAFFMLWRGSHDPVFYMLITLESCVWLLCAYHYFASNPIVMQYAFMIVTCLLIMAAFYEYVAIVMKRGHTRLFYTFAYASVGMGMLELADYNLSLSYMLLYAVSAFVIMNLLQQPIELYEKNK